MNTTRQQVAVVIGATSKWQADGRNTKLAHGRELDDSDMAVGARWGIGGAVAQKFADGGLSRCAYDSERLQRGLRWRVQFTS